MKKLYILTLALFVSVFSFGQETLSNGDFELWDDASTPTGWTHVENTTQETTEIHGGVNAAKQESTSGTKDLGQLITGITPGESYTLTIWYKVIENDGEDARIWSTWKDSEGSSLDNDVDILHGYLDNNAGEWTEYSIMTTAPAAAADFYFEVRTYTGATVYWDDLSFFQEAGSPDPSIIITSPSTDEILSPLAADSMEANFVVNNFVVAATDGGGDGHVHYKIDDGDTVMIYTTDPITLTDLGVGEHTVDMWLVDNTHTPLDPAVETSVTFTIADYTMVANLAELRAGTIGEYYQVTGEVVATFQRETRNQKWIQDATAGILIDDNDGVITTTYVAGDAVTNLKGKLNAYSGLLQLNPIVDPGAPSSTGNVVVPVEVTLADLVANLADYESELVLIMDATLTDHTGDGADGTFQTGKNYPFTDASGESILRTNFNADEVDYIGELLPAAVMDYICIVGSYSGTAQVTPRSLDDMFHVGIANQTIAGFTLYPNPTKGVLSITTQNNLEKDIQISDLLGKQVFHTTTNNLSIDVSNLNKGVYIIQVTEAGLTATRKLVVE